MRHLFVLAALGSTAIACGDNSKQCGAGTIERGGECTPDGTNPPTCTDGTILVVDSNSCVIDPDACQDGTVLVGTECVDPGHLTIDVEEGIEPNGLTFFGEASADSAGEIVIKPAGETTVIHGKIIPFQDADGDGQIDPDVDTYRITITAPTLIDVSVDGLHGMVGGFMSVAVVAPTDALDDWTRLGITASGDTSKRQLYLPVPGTYVIVVADSRTLLTDATAGKQLNNADALDFEYYLSITEQPTTATALTPTAGVASASGTLVAGEVKLFTVPMGTGTNSATLDIPATQTTASVVVVNASGNTRTTKAVSDETSAPATTPPMVGFLAGDVTTVVVDHVTSFAIQPVDFDLDVTVSN